MESPRCSISHLPLRSQGGLRDERDLSAAVPLHDERRERFRSLTGSNGFRQAVLSPVRDGAGASALIDG